jgi:general secretion pathway protein G
MTNAWRSARAGIAAPRKCGDGFTLIELIIVLGIVALLLTIVVPRYYGSVERARDVTLRQTLAVVRDAIDKFHGDNGRYPESLEELVDKRYIKDLPLDPVTGERTTWLILAPPAAASTRGDVYDVRSGAPGAGRDGKPFRDY